MLKRQRKVGTNKENKQFRREKSWYYIEILLISSFEGQIGGTCQFRVNFISREDSRSELNRAFDGILNAMKSTKISPARFRGLAASVHRSIYPSTHPCVYFAHPSRMPKTMRRHRGAGSLARAVVRDACSSAFIPSLVRSLPPTRRSSLQNEHRAILDSLRWSTASPWCRANSSVSTREIAWSAAIEYRTIEMYH
jgi:hypothetical protein